MTSTANGGPLVAVVIPCYRSSRSVREIVSRLETAFPGMGLEVVLVDDASPINETWETLSALAAESGGVVRAFRLARNVGQHNAILCGLSQISPAAAFVVTMDDDLQQMPEDVPLLVGALLAGADIAIGAYPVKKHAWWRNLGGKLIDATLRRIFGLPQSFQLTSFRAFRRYAAEEVIENRSRYTYLTAALLSITRRRVNVPVRHEERQDGQSGYQLGRSLELALSLYLTYSRMPLYLILLLFVTSMGVTLSITVWTLIRYLTTAELLAGWTSQMIMMGLCSTLNLAATAVVALLATRSHRITASVYGHWRIAEKA